MFFIALIPRLSSIDKMKLPNVSGDPFPIFDSQNISIKVNPIKTEFYPTPAKRPMYSVLEKTKIKDRIELEIPFWRDSLKVAIFNLL